MKKILYLVMAVFTLYVFNQSAFAEDSPEKTKENIRAAYELFNNKDFQNLGMYLAEDVIDHTPGFPGQAPGLEGVFQCANMHYTGFPDFNFTIDEIIVEGNKAAVKFTFKGTNTGEFFGMPATNKSVNVEGLELLIFENGKAKERWGYIDMQKLMEQLGMSK